MTPDAADGREQRAGVWTDEAEEPATPSRAGGDEAEPGSPPGQSAARSDEAEPGTLVDPSPRGALRRSLLVWGWGQAALGRPAALALAAVQAAAIVAMLAAALTIGLGTGVELVFLGLAALAVAWGAVALDAYRRAADRRATSDGAGGDGGAIELLWLAPPVIMATALLWGLGGSGASSSSVTARYVSAWQHDRSAQAATLFASPPASASLADAWERQEALLRSELIKASAAAGPDAGIDPARPFESLSFTIDPERAGDGMARMRVQIVWWETTQGTFLGLVPPTSRRQVTYEDIGAIEVGRRDMAGPLGVTPAGSEWRIERVDLLGVEVRSGD